MFPGCCYWVMEKTSFPFSHDNFSHTMCFLAVEHSLNTSFLLHILHRLDTYIMLRQCVLGLQRLLDKLIVRSPFCHTYRQWGLVSNNWPFSTRDWRASFIREWIVIQYDGSASLVKMHLCLYYTNGNCCNFDLCQFVTLSLGHTFLIMNEILAEKK